MIEYIENADNPELDPIHEELDDFQHEVVSEIEENQEFESFYVDDKGEVIEDWNIIKKVPYLGLDWSWFDSDADYWY